MKKNYTAPLMELIGVNPLDVITASGGILSNLFDANTDANSGNTYTGEVPSGWGMY